MSSASKQSPITVYIAHCCLTSVNRQILLRLFIESLELDDLIMRFRHRVVSREEAEEGPSSLLLFEDMHHFSCNFTVCYYISKCCRFIDICYECNVA